MMYSEVCACIQRLTRFFLSLRMEARDRQVRLKRSYFGEVENYLNDNLIIEYRFAQSKDSILAIPKHITRFAFVTEKTQLDTSRLDCFTIKISDLTYNEVLDLYEIVTKKSLNSDCVKLVEIDFTLSEYTDFLRFFNSRVNVDNEKDEGHMIFFTRYIFIYYREIGISIFKRERRTAADKCVENILNNYEELGKIRGISFAISPDKATELIKSFDLNCNWSINVSFNFAKGMRDVYHNVSTTALAIVDSSF